MIYQSDYISMDEWVILINLFGKEIGERIRAKKHLTIGYSYDLLTEFIQRAYIEGKKAARLEEQHG